MTTIKIDKKATEYLQDTIGSGSGGGVVLVDTLPEEGQENTLYKTPDGKIWSCTDTTTEETVCDLEVGKSYKLKNEIELSDFQEFFSKYNDYGFYFTEDEYTLFDIYEEKTIQYIDYIVNTDKISYRASFIVPEGYTEEKVAITLEEFTEVPSVTITEYFIESIQNEDAELIDFAFLFEGGSHTEEVTTSTWTEVGGSSSGGNNSLQIVKIVEVTEGTIVTLDKTNEEIFEMCKKGLVAIADIGYREDTDFYYNDYAIIINSTKDEYGFTFYFLGQDFNRGVLTYDKSSGLWTLEPLS